MVERPASPTEGFSVQAPLVYQYGHVSMQKNPSLYNMLVSRLAEVVQDRMQANKKGKYVPFLYLRNILIHFKPFYCIWVKSFFFVDVKDLENFCRA